MTTQSLPPRRRPPVSSQRRAHPPQPSQQAPAPTPPGASRRIRAVVRVVVRALMLVLSAVRWSARWLLDTFTRAPDEVDVHSAEEHVPRSAVRSASRTRSQISEIERAQRRKRDQIEDRARQRQHQKLKAQLRLVLLVVLVIGLGVLSYTVPRMSVFSVKRISVEGTSAISDLAVRRQIDPVIAHSTIYTMDASAIRSRLKTFPFVHSVAVDGHFPNGLSIRVTEYQPLALGVAVGSGSWLVARDGRVLARVRSADWTGKIPKVVIEEGELAAGQRLSHEPALNLLRLVPPTFPGTFDTVEVFTPGRHVSKKSGKVDALAGTENVIARMSDGPEIRFGRPDQFEEKLAVAERLLSVYGPSKRSSITYIDVSVPSRPAVMS